MRRSPLISWADVMSEKSIALLILSGGMSTRFGNRRKILLECEGRSFASRILDAFEGFDRVYLSVDREEKYRELGLPMIEDKFPGCGPLGGIASGLMACEEDALFVVACDMPFVTKEAVRRMLESYAGRDGILLAANGDLLEPLFGIYPRTVLETAVEMLENGHYRARDLFSAFGGNVVQIGDRQSFVNINTPEEYRMYAGNGDGSRENRKVDSGS